jgi:succinate dehydrogenase / fumarate reductase cytochrome b subunit
MARPKHLNLFQIRQPIPAYVSILHRISGAGLFLFIGFLLWLLEGSLASAQSYAVIKGTMGHPLVKILLFGLIWAFLHHLFAGVRHLALDLHIGAELAAARTSSYLVLAASIGLTVILGVSLW